MATLLYLEQQFFVLYGGWLAEVESRLTHTAECVSPARGESSPTPGWAELADKDVEGKLKSLQNRQPRESQSQFPTVPTSTWLCEGAVAENTSLFSQL